MKGRKGGESRCQQAKENYGEIRSTLEEHRRASTKEHDTMMDLDPEDIFGEFSYSFLRTPVFNNSYRVKKMRNVENERKLENGGRVLLPPSCLSILAHMAIDHPWLFEIRSKAGDRSSHCGVQEFTAEEGTVRLPAWLMAHLNLKENGVVELRNASLPVARFVKIKPQSVDFLDLTNPRAVLENTLRAFSCLTVDDIISIGHGKKVYKLKIVSLGENVKAARIIDCDLEVDFEPPVGYTEPTPESRQEELLRQSEEKLSARVLQAARQLDESSSQSFRGSKSRLDGKHRSKGSQQSSEAVTPRSAIPDYEFAFGSLKFIRLNRTSESARSASSESDTKPFVGHSARIKSTHSTPRDV